MKQMVRSPNFDNTQPTPAAAAEMQNAEKSPGVKSALRVLHIFEYFARSTRPATLAQLSKQMDLPKSSCFALLETLRQEGYLYWLGKDKGYYPTRRWGDLGDAITRHDPILSVVSPLLARLCEQTGETAVLAKREGHQVLYLDAVEPSHVLRFTAQPGQLKPIHSSASGRALLEQMPVAARLELIGQLDLRRFSDQTIVDPDQLAQSVEEGARRGWHVAFGEYQSDATAIAASFQFGAEDYAFIVGASTPRVADRIDEIGTLVAAHAREMAAFALK
jgi:DNA-binding IclR family transcriptional regulator